MCSEQDPLSRYKRFEMGILILFFHKKKTGAKHVAKAPTKKDIISK